LPIFQNTPPHEQSSTPDTCRLRLCSILSLSLDAGKFFGKLLLSFVSLPDRDDRFDCFVKFHTCLTR